MYSLLVSNDWKTPHYTFSKSYLNHLLHLFCHLKICVFAWKYSDYCECTLFLTFSTKYSTFAFYKYVTIIVLKALICT